LGERLAREQRRLAAVVSTDVAGYSRLMGRDESGTLAALKVLRREVIDPQIASHGGRIVKTTGDGLLLQFASVVDAVSCMIEVQTAMAVRSAAMPDDRRIAFRVGINVGDIIIDSDDIFGDGVNVAARLQELSLPGGIAVSGRVRDDVIDRLDARFEEAGPQTLKNIARPVPVWRWAPDTDTPPAFHRHAAIVVTDLAQFSSLMKRDEGATLAALRNVRREIIDPRVARNGGRRVKSLGDGLMLEFAESVDAVRCALEIQVAIAERYAALPEDRRVAYRIGIHYGDIIVDEDDIMGEGANVAYRIESFAEPGGICLSDTVYRQVEGRIVGAFVSMGERRVRGIDAPMLLWHLKPGAQTPA